MPKYEVEITETLTYKIEVEADSREEAKDAAFDSYKFADSDFDDNDAEVTVVCELDE